MHHTLRRTSLAVALALATACALAVPKTMTLPPDGAELRPSDLPGYAKAQANCVSCHSAEYMLFQPPNASRGYWDAMTKRMKAVFKAPIDDADIPVIVDYLAATYGNKGK
jgi:mono/diheme cytochrome c family protein